MIFIGCFFFTTNNQKPQKTGKKQAKIGQKQEFLKNLQKIVKKLLHYEKACAIL
jgi:hypothetical protein